MESRDGDEMAATFLPRRHEWQHPHTAGDIIRALACGYGRRARAKKPMVLLRAFVDDSASDTWDRRLFLAGYLHNADAWAMLSDAWERELKRHPSISYFKMQEADSLDKKGQFAGWTPDERDKKVFALAHIINHFKPITIYCSVSRTEHDRIIKPVAPYPIQNPYHVCFSSIIQLTAQYLASHNDDDIPPVDFVFDEQGNLGTQAALWYRWEKENNPSYGRFLGAPPICRDDKLVVALQAADMVAWHIRREYQYGPERRPIGSMIIDHAVCKDIDAATLEIAAAKIVTRTNHWPERSFVMPLAIRQLEPSEPQDPA